MKSPFQSLSFIAVLTFFIHFVLLTAPTSAATTQELQFQYESTLELFKNSVVGAQEILSKAKGVLIIPNMWKAGFGLGGEYGEGILKTNNEIKNYYSLFGLSIGWQFGVQQRNVILIFLDETYLDKFIASEGWEFGIDFSATLINIGVDGDITSLTHNTPVVAFTIDQKGFMANLSLEGYKLTKIVR